MLKQTEGIVLRTFPFGEADLIVTYLTLNFGIIKVFAKSPRKIKSRFGSSLEPLTRARIAFWGKEDAGLPRLTQSDIVYPYQALRDDLSCFLKLLELVELTMNFIPERDVNSKAYLLLSDTLRDVEGNLLGISVGNGRVRDKSKEISSSLLISHYKIKFLELVGFAPKLDVCGRCAKKGYHFYLSQGSILCEACAKGEQAMSSIGQPIRISPPVLRFYSDLLTWDTAKIMRIKPSEALLSELSDIINTHIKYILSKPLKSESFMHMFHRG